MREVVRVCWWDRGAVKPSPVPWGSRLWGAGKKADTKRGKESAKRILTLCYHCSRHAACVPWGWAIRGTLLC